jgi:hypothetical protein
MFPLLLNAEPFMLEEGYVITGYYIPGIILSIDI